MTKKDANISIYTYCIFCKFQCSFFPWFLIFLLKVFITSFDKHLSLFIFRSHENIANFFESQLPVNHWLEKNPSARSPRMFTNSLNLGIWQNVTIIEILRNQGPLTVVSKNLILKINTSKYFKVLSILKNMDVVLTIFLTKFFWLIIFTIKTFEIWFSMISIIYYKSLI